MSNVVRIYLQYPIVDIYGNHRFIDFALNFPDGRVAIEVDGNTWHQPGKASEQKYHDDLLKQNSIVYDGWKKYHVATLPDLRYNEVGPSRPL